MGFDIYDKSFYNMHLQWKPFYKLIADWIMENTDFNTSVEYGCGNGFLSEYFQASGKQVTCSDFSLEAGNYVAESIKPFFSSVDMTVPIEDAPAKDLALCFEVAEHIDPAGTDVFFENLVKTSPKHILFSSEPTTSGWGHINCHPEEFWVDSICKRGYTLNQELTDKFRNDLGESTQQISWYANNFLYFDKV